MDIFVAGASSFAGNYLTKFLLKKNVRIFGTFFKNKLKIKSNNFVPIKIDLTKKIDFNRKFDFIIHVASHHKISDFIKNPQKKIKRNILMTKNILNYCFRNNIKKIIFFSTIDIDKVDFPKKKIHYIKSKIQSEKLYLDQKKRKKIKIIILRLPAIIGKNCNQNFFSTTYERLKKNKTVKLWNSKDLYDNFIHIEDLSKFIFFIIKKSGNLNKSIIECKSINPLKLKETISLVKRKTSSNSKIYIDDSIKKGNKFKNKNKYKYKYNFFTAKKAISQFLKENQ